MASSSEAAPPQNQDALVLQQMEALREQAKLQPTVGARTKILDFAKDFNAAVEDVWSKLCCNKV